MSVIAFIKQLDSDTLTLIFMRLILALNLFNN